MAAQNAPYGWFRTAGMWGKFAGTCPSTLARGYDNLHMWPYNMCSGIKRHNQAVVNITIRTDTNKVT
jgi:hypothetical protein